MKHEINSIFISIFTASNDIFGESSTSRLGGLSAYCDQIDAAEPPRRFKSSLLGGEIPYGSGSQRFILTQAQRKEYPPTPPTTATTSDSPKTNDENIIREPTNILPEQQLINLTTQKQPEDASTPEPPVVRCSVIQRVPSVSSSSLESSSSSSPSPPIVHHKRHMYHRMQSNNVMMPVQEHPIDYHIPKKRDIAPSNGQLIGCEEDEDKRIKKIDLMEEREKRIREAKRAILHRALLAHIRRLPPGSPMVGRLAGIVQAAAGHGRSSSNNNSGQANNSGNASSNGTSGGSINFSGSAGCGGNSGSAGGLGGSGAGGNGRDNRSNYGPNSPPTGSLPPFYESLKGGANGGLNAYNAQNGMNGNAFNNYLLNSTLAQMDCDANGELTNIGGYPSSPQDAANNTKQYSVLQNVYLQNGMVLKDEIDLDYDGKIDTLSLNGNLLQNYSDGYTDSMMAELSNAVDPLQLTATLTFSSPNEHALLESLTDAVDLSQFLQRLPSDDDQCNDLELSSTSSLTPDSNGDHHQQHHNLDSFQDHLIGGRHNGFSNDRQLFYKSSPPSSTSSYENPPPYQTRDNNGLHNSLLQQQHHQHIAQNGFDLDSSLPSPANSSPYDSLHSPQQQNHHHNNNNNMTNGNEHQPSTTPSPNATTIQNVSRSLKSNNRRAASKLSSLLASATTPEPPIVAEVLQQRVSKVL
jgi:ovo